MSHYNYNVQVWIDDENFTVLPCNHPNWMRKDKPEIDQWKHCCNANAYMGCHIQDVEAGAFEDIEPITPFSIKEV